MELYTTPPSNRGLNLQVGIDYLTFTHKFADIDSFAQFADSLAEEFRDRVNWSKDRATKIGQYYDHGFRSLSGFTLAYKICEKSGLITSIFQLGGSVLKSIPLQQLLRYFTYTLLPMGVFVTRLDISCDDHSGTLFALRQKMTDLCDLRETNPDAKKLTVGFRKYKFIKSDDDGFVGRTLYLGSRQSNAYSRIYDKRLLTPAEEKRKEEKRTEEKRMEDERMEWKRMEENGMEENGGEENVKDGSVNICQYSERNEREDRREWIRKRKRSIRKGREEKRREFANRLSMVRSGEREFINDAPKVEIYTRWETEYKSDSANNLFSTACNMYRLLDSEDKVHQIQKMFTDLMFTRYQFLEERRHASLDRQNIVASWWTEFLELVKHQKLKLPKVTPAKSIQKTIDFLERQVATSIAMASKFYGIGFDNWFYRLIESGLNRMSEEQMLMLEIAMSQGLSEF